MWILTVSKSHEVFIECKFGVIAKLTLSWALTGWKDSKFGYFEGEIDWFLLKWWFVFGWVILKALDRGAAVLKVDKLATGHNADDIAETVLLNILRGDIAR